MIFSRYKKIWVYWSSRVIHSQLTSVDLIKPHGVASRTLFVHGIFG